MRESYRISEKSRQLDEFVGISFREQAIHASLQFDHLLGRGWALSQTIKHGGRGARQAAVVGTGYGPATDDDLLQLMYDLGPIDYGRGCIPEGLDDMGGGGLAGGGKSSSVGLSVAGERHG